jgi:hypothetical protein
MTADDFRDIALGMNGAIESAHMGHPDFRANGRIFATLQADEKSGMVKLTPEEQAELMGEHPRMFTPAAGAWGRQGSTMVNLHAADEATVRGAMLLAWQSVTSMPSKSSSSKARKAKPTRPSGKGR